MDGNSSLQLLDALPLQAWTATSRGDIDFANAFMCEYAGLPQEQLVGEGWRSLVHPSDLPSVAQRWESSIGTGEPFEAELRLFEKSSQQYRWHLVRASRTAIEGALRWAGVYIDINASKRAQEVREASMEHIRLERERIRSLFAQTPVAISVTIGPTHRIDQMNAPARRLIGGRHVEGKTAREAFPEMVEQGIFEMLDAVYMTGRPYEGREACVSFVRDEGGEACEGYFNLSYQPLRDEQDSVYGVMGVSVEVTDQVRARQEVERLAAEREAVLAQLSEGVIITDAQGRITFVNETANALHGIARLDVPPEEYARTYQLLTVEGEPYPSQELPLARAVLRDEVVKGARWRIRRPDGTTVLVQGDASPVSGHQDQKIGAVLTMHEVHERAS
jgi:PAS domain S-box-containing protein